MRFLKNSEIIATYSVSDKTVRNWIVAAENGVLELKLCKLNGKSFIADTHTNSILLDKMASTGRKYRNSLSSIDIDVPNNFYATFNDSQISDIISNLSRRHEALGAYKYFGEGGKYWSRFLDELVNTGLPNLINNTIEALDTSYPRIEATLSRYKHINVVSLCGGNANTTKKLLERVQATGKLRKYIVIDISPEMIKTNVNNATAWLGKDTAIETYQRDLTYHRFGDVLVKDSYGDDASLTINILLLVAGVIVNFNNPDQVLDTIAESISSEDILITTLKKDTNKTRNSFDFNISADNSALSVHETYLLEQLGIKSELYYPEQIFEPETRTRSLRVVLKKNLNLNFDKGNFRRTLKFNNGDRIILWHALHHTDKEIQDRFIRTGFKIFHMSSSVDEELSIVIARLSNRFAPNAL